MFSVCLCVFCIFVVVVLLCFCLFVVFFAFFCKHAVLMFYLPNILKDKILHELRKYGFFPIIQFINLALK